MRNALLVARRELGGYFRSPMGYVIAAIVLFVNGLWFNSDYVAGGPAKLSADVLRGFFAVAALMAMIAGLLLSMRLFAEEKQLGTLTLLLTAPIREAEIVLGKFLSALAFLLVITLLSLYMPALIFVNGKVSLGHIAGGYFGLMLLGAIALAVGLFASVIAPNQVVAAVSGGAIMAAIYWGFQGAAVAEEPFRDILAYLSPHRHLQWQNGVINSKDVVYYVSMTYFFLLLTTHVLQARRWR